MKNFTETGAVMGMKSHTIEMTYTLLEVASVVGNSQLSLEKCEKGTAISKSSLQHFSKENKRYRKVYDYGGIVYAPIVLSILLGEISIQDVNLHILLTILE